MFCYMYFSIKKDLGICQYYKWFTFAVQKWLHIAKHKAYRRIHKAVELDKVGTLKYQFPFYNS